MKLGVRLPLRPSGRPHETPSVNGDALERDRSGPLIIWLFVAACIGAVAWRFFVLSAQGVPPGIDGGNWLAFGNDLLGRHVQPDGVVYPPLVPLLVTGLERTLGATNGLSLVAALSAVAPAAAVFTLLYWAGLRWPALLLATFLLPASAISEASAWGGYPQLVGLAFLLGMLWFLDRWLREGSARHLVGLGATTLLLLATSHFAAAVGLFSAIGVVIVDVLVPKPARPLAVLRRGMAAAGVMMVAALPLAFIYWHLIRAITETQNPEPSISITVDTFASRFTSILGGAWPLWVFGLVLLPFSLWSVRRLGSPLFSLTGGMAIGLTVFLLLTGEARTLHELTIVAVLSGGLWLLQRDGRIAQQRHDLKNLALAGAALLALCAVTLSGARDLPNHRNFYRLLTPGSVQAIAWLKDHTPDGSLIAVSDVMGAPLGWWVEGLGQRSTLAASPAYWLVFPAERERAQEANELFDLMMTDPARGFRSARLRGVDYVLTVRSSSTFAPLSREAAGIDVPTVFENDGALVLQVPEIP